MTTEREFNRNHATLNVVPVDDDLAPNRTTKSSRLTSPENPEPSGLVMRKARDGNGVAAGAEDLVAAASSGGGSALPVSLMRKFESALGTDLSSVRIHTDAASATAAEAVGARAYAMGQDIHFAAGQYDPSSGSGEHLLAHEVAHTVQQRGGTPTRQNKLEVSSPHDAAEHEADRAADAMVSGIPFAIAGSAAGAARKVFRKPEWDGGLSGKLTVGSGFAKYQFEYSKKVEPDKERQKGLFFTIAGQLSAGGEGHVSWDPDSSGAGVSQKGSNGKEGKRSTLLEGELPIWKKEAAKVAHAEGEKALMDYIWPVKVVLVVGAEGSDKPGDGAETPAEKKGAIAVGIKCETKSGDNFTLKVQAVEAKKKNDKYDVSGPAAKLNYDKKFKSNPIPVRSIYDNANLVVTGNVKPEMTIKPNYTKIAEELAKRGVPQMAQRGAQIASKVILGTMDVAVAAGPPLLAAALIAHSIYIYGEKGRRDADILAGVKDARQATMDFAQMMCGNDTPMGTGPISEQAQQRARAELAQIAASNNVSVEQLMTELRNQTTPSDFSRIYNQTKLQALSAYQGTVNDAIAAWRKEHYVAAAFTRQEDDFNSVWKTVEIVWH